MVIDVTNPTIMFQFLIGFMQSIDKYIRKLKTHNWDLRNVGAIWRLKNLTNQFEYEIRVADESSFARKRRQMKCPVQIC